MCPQMERPHNSRPPVLVVAAVRQELGPFLKNGSCGTQVLLTGMGRRRASAAVRKALRNGSYRCVVSTGFAGGTGPGFRTGDLVVASEVIEAGSLRRWPAGETTARLKGSFRVGPFLTVEKLCGDPSAKQEAARRFGAIGVEMETSAVAEAASEAGLPWVGVRAILDPAEVEVSIGSWFFFLTAMKVASRSLAQGLAGIILPL